MNELTAGQELNKGDRVCIKENKVYKVEHKEPEWCECVTPVKGDGLTYAFNQCCYCIKPIKPGTVIYKDKPIKPKEEIRRKYICYLPKNVEIEIEEEQEKDI